MNSEALGRFLRFCITGVANTLIHVGVVVLLVEAFTAFPPLANVVAFSIATLFSYVVNTLWSFRSRPSRRSLFRFWIVCLLCLLLAFGISWVIEALGFHYLVGVFSVIAVTVPVGFGLHQCWTYRE
ncbi:MAG: GtrA family protein [Opitutales bacterium]|nr:GtrA family protein [Opitutales bacterium]